MGRKEVLEGQDGVAVDLNSRDREADGEGQTLEEFDGQRKVKKERKLKEELKMPIGKPKKKNKKAKDNVATLPPIAASLTSDVPTETSQSQPGPGGDHASIPLGSKVPPKKGKGTPPGAAAPAIKDEVKKPTVKRSRRPSTAGRKLKEGTGTPPHIVSTTSSTGNLIESIQQDESVSSNPATSEMARKPPKKKRDMFLIKAPDTLGYSYMSPKKRDSRLPGSKIVKILRIQKGTQVVKLYKKHLCICTVDLDYNNGITPGTLIQLTWKSETDKAFARKAAGICFPDQTIQEMIDREDAVPVPDYAVV